MRKTFWLFDFSENPNMANAEHEPNILIVAESTFSSTFGSSFRSYFSGSFDYSSESDP